MLPNRVTLLPPSPPHLRLLLEKLFIFFVRNCHSTAAATCRSLKFELESSCQNRPFHLIQHFFKQWIGWEWGRAFLGFGYSTGFFSRNLNPGIAGKFCRSFYSYIWQSSLVKFAKTDRLIVGSPRLVAKKSGA